MPEHANERIRVDASPARCFAVATDFERYPEWARDVKEATVVERDEEGRGALVRYRAAAIGKSVTYTLRYDYGDAPQSFAWKLEQGDMLRALDGEYRFEPDGDGTRVHYDLTVDLAAAIPGFMKRRAAGMIMGTALRELKREAERTADPGDA